MKDGKGEYNVVFRNTGMESPGYKGVVTWTTFASQEQFQAWFNEELRNRYEVVAEGVTAEEAVEHSRSTPLNSQLNAAVQEATDRDGNVNGGVLAFQLTNIALASMLDAKESAAK